MILEHGRINSIKDKIGPQHIPLHINNYYEARAREGMEEIVKFWS